MIPYEVFRFLCRLNERYEWRPAERSPFFDWWYVQLQDWNIERNDWNFVEWYGVTNEMTNGLRAEVFGPGLITEIMWRCHGIDHRLKNGGHVTYLDSRKG